MKIKAFGNRNGSRILQDETDLLKTDSWTVHEVRGADRITGGGSPFAISLPTAGVAYTQNFDTLALSGTTNTALPTDWFFLETGTGANTTYAAGTGSDNAGNTYSFGASTAPDNADRAFGTLLSGSVTSTIGASFTNNTGATITSLDISYFGEQWRIGNTATARDDRLDFQYSLDATSLNTGTWTDVNSLDFINIIKSAASAGTLNGNDSANRTAIISSITGLTIANGQTFWIRWVDLNATGSDDGLAIDNFSLTANTGAALPTVSINDVSMTEGDSGTVIYTFTVSLSAPAGAGGVTFDIATANGTASAGSDYVARTLTSQTIPSGQSTYTFDVTVNGDTAFEGDETFLVNLTNVTGATVLDGQGQGTITNNDVVQPGSLSIGDFDLAEGNSGTTAFVFTVLRSGGSDGAVAATWTLDTSGGAGLANAADFAPGQATTGTVNFADGQTSATITILVQGDVAFEADETFGLTLSNATGGATLGNVNGTGLIINDDGAPAGELSINDVSAAEGNSGTTAFTFTVTRANGSAGAVSASYVINLPGPPNGADGSDFVVGQGFTGTVNFADGETVQSITVNVQGDVDFENDESFTVLLSDPTGGATITDGTGAGTIQNDDAAPAGGFSINDVSVTEGDAGTSILTFTVSRTGGSAGTVTVDYTTANDTAVAGTDYVATSGFLTFLDGETSKTVSVTINGDTTFEANETFFVNLTGATGGAAILDSQGVGTITNDDAAPAPGSVSVGDVSITEGNSGTSILTFTLTRTGGTAAFDVNFATSNGGAANHASATAGSDYLAASGTVSFGDGVNTQTVSITINGDVTPELSEEFTLTLSSPTNGATLGDGTAIGTITTDDAAPASTLIFTENFTGFTGGGFAPTPTAGQIDSDIWRVVGLSDIANPAYGFTGAAGTDFGRGTITTNDPTTAGVYSLSSNAAMILQPTGAEIEAGGYIEAQIINTSGSTATGFDVAFDWVYRNNADRASSLTFSYSTDGTNFITVPAAAFTTPGTLVSGATFTAQNESLSLGGLSVANGDAIYFRWTHASSAGSGSRDEFGIDNVSVSTTGGASGPLVSVSDVSVNEAAGTMTFTVTRANVGAGAFTVDYATADGTALAGSDYVATSGTLSFADNQTSATVTVTINDDGIAELNETLFLNLTNPVGATIADTQAVGTIVNDDGTPIQVSVNDVSIVEGQSGTSILTFTVTRTGGTGAFDVSFTTADDTATAGSDYVATSGTLNFGAGVNTQTISVTINGDLTQEQTERFFVNLTNPTNNAVIIDGQGIGTITNDEPTLIHDIQGTAYFSPLLAGGGVLTFNTASSNAYTVRAIVTAVDNVGARQGFYVTEEVTDWDGNSYTSEGIFVMTRNDANVGTVVSGVTVGDLVQFSANIMEYQSFSTMPRTVLVNPTGLSVVSSGNPLPTLVLTGIPNEIMTVANPDYFDSVDGVGDTFDASLYALSFFETVEGMLVTVPNMVVADGFVSTSGGDPYFQAYSLDSANADQINSRGGYTIAGDPPIGPPDTPGTGDDTVNGGQVLHDGDVNPDIIEVDFTDFAISAPTGLATSASMGDFLGDITGIIDFDFTALKLFVTAIDPGSFVDNTPAIETTAFGDDARSLTVATFNVENLDPSDGAARFTAIANAIANNLNSPDIICIEEMQDNNGAAAGGVDASTTWGMLVAALNLATGKNYQWVDQDPISNAEGGEQQGNIRVGFLYDTDRVQLGNLDANATLAERRMYTDRIGDGVRDAGDLIAFDDSMLGAEISTTDWANTRRSLLGEFNFNGNTVYVTANHWPSKGGSGEFWQLDQAGGDPINSDVAQRSAVAQDVYSMMNLIQSANANAGIVAGGDFNDFYFYRPLTTVTGYTMADGSARVGGARFDNLTLTLDEAERYTYTFDGRSQAIDHIIVNQLLSGVATYDVVHLNTGFNPSGSPALSDHEPGIATFDYRNFSEILTGTAGIDMIEGFGGNDTLRGGNGNDVLDGGPGIDILDGGANDDVLFVDADDSVIEAVGGGNDIVAARTSFALNAGAQVEILSTTNDSGTAAIALTGNEFAQLIIGNAGNNFLYGAGGADMLDGGAGDDVIIVDADDSVLEAAGGGNDLVASLSSYALNAGAEVETLSTTNAGGLAAIALTGNEFGQTIIGNAGANFLNGGGGIDILNGGAGDDIYIVVHPSDQVIEAAGQGSDIVYSSVSWVLTAGSEVEVLGTSNPGGNATLALTGNELGQTIIGNAGNNFLYGAGGVDILNGGAGDDVMIVDSDDSVIEAAGGGNDLVASLTSYTLNAGAEVETLSTTNGGGNAAINLTGNALAQTIIGNAGSNVLDGKGGNDTLQGLGGADFFAFTTALGAGNVDTIADFSVVDDTIQLDDAIFTALGGLGTLNANAFVTGTAAADADDRIIYNSATGALFYDADGNGAGAAVQFATLSTGLALTASDFAVI